jgi:hypothetical protein
MGNSVMFFLRRFIGIHLNHEGTGRTFHYMNSHVNDDLQVSRYAGQNYEIVSPLV